MMDLKSKIGEKAGPVRVLVDAERVARFCLAVGRTGSGSDLTQVPPTFFTVCRDAEFEILARIGVPLKKVLHGEQEYELLGDVRVGDELVYESRLSHVLEKNGASGHMAFMQYETEIQNQRGELVGRARSTIIFREKSA